VTWFNWHLVDAIVADCRHLAVISHAAAKHQTVRQTNCAAFFAHYEAHCRVPVRNTEPPLALVCCQIQHNKMQVCDHGIMQFIVSSCASCIPCNRHVNSDGKINTRASSQSDGKINTRASSQSDGKTNTRASSQSDGKTNTWALCKETVERRRRQKQKRRRMNQQTHRCRQQSQRQAPSEPISQRNEYIKTMLVKITNATVYR